MLAACRVPAEVIGALSMPQLVERCWTIRCGSTSYCLTITRPGWEVLEGQCDALGGTDGAGRCGQRHRGAPGAAAHCRRKGCGSRMCGISHGGGRGARGKGGHMRKFPRLVWGWFSWARPCCFPDAGSRRARRAWSWRGTCSRRRGRMRSCSPTRRRNRARRRWRGRARTLPPSWRGRTRRRRSLPSPRSRTTRLVPARGAHRAGGPPLIPERTAPRKAWTFPRRLFLRGAHFCGHYWKLAGADGIMGKKRLEAETHGGRYARAVPRAGGRVRLRKDPPHAHAGDLHRGGLAGALAGAGPGALRGRRP